MLFFVNDALFHQTEWSLIIFELLWADKIFGHAPQHAEFSVARDSPRSRSAVHFFLLLVLHCEVKHAKLGIKLVVFLFLSSA